MAEVQSSMNAETAAGGRKFLGKMLERVYAGPFRAGETARGRCANRSVPDVEEGDRALKRAPHRGRCTPAPRGRKTLMALGHGIGGNSAQEASLLQWVAGVVGSPGGTIIRSSSTSSALRPRRTQRRV